METFADYADVKSPWFVGHSRARRRWPQRPRARAGLPPADIQLVERAGLVCRLGVIGVSAGVLDRPGPLSDIEWERVRTVPYLTERVLKRQPLLAQIGAVAGKVHERIGRLRLPPRALGRAIPPGRPSPGRGAGVPGGARGAPYRPALSGADARHCCSPRWPRSPRRRGRRRRAGRRRAPDAPPTEPDRWTEPPRARSPHPPRPWALEQADRSGADGVPADGRQPHRAHLHEDRRHAPAARRRCTPCATVSSTRACRRIGIAQ